jgi:hypothetical protein
MMYHHMNIPLNLTTIFDQTDLFTSFLQTLQMKPLLPTNASQLPKLHVRWIMNYEDLLGLLKS